MTSLPSVIPADQRPADLQAMWDTAIGAHKDDDAPWGALADYADEHGFHGIAAACRHPRGNWFAGQPHWITGGMAIVINKGTGWWAARTKGGIGFDYLAEHGIPKHWERLEPVLRADA